MTPVTRPPSSASPFTLRNELMAKAYDAPLRLSALNERQCAQIAALVTTGYMSYLGETEYVALTDKGRREHELGFRVEVRGVVA